MSHRKSFIFVLFQQFLLGTSELWLQFWFFFPFLQHKSLSNAYLSRTFSFHPEIFTNIGKIHLHQNSEAQKWSYVVIFLIWSLSCCLVRIQKKITEKYFLHYTMNVMVPWLTLHCLPQKCYVHNLLRVTVYIPSIRRDILDLIIGKMLQLDVSNSKSYTI